MPLKNKPTRRQAEEELQIKTWAIESAINAIAIADLQGILEYVNPAFLKLWGYGSAAQVVGRSATEFWSVPEKAEEIMRELAASGGWIGEMKAKARDGVLFDVQVSASMIKNVGGEPIRTMATFINVTGRRQTEAALQESENRLRKIIELAPIAMAIVGMDETIEYINRKAVTVFGYPHEDIPTMERWWRLAYPDDAYRKKVVADWAARIRKALTEGSEIAGNEYRVTCKNGEVKTMFISGVPVSDKLFVMFDDITERKRAEAALKESEEKFSKAFRTSPYSYLIARLDDGKIIEVNDSFTAVSGFTREEALAGSTSGLNIWVTEEERQRMIAALRATGVVEGMETQLRAKDGSVKTVLLFARLLRIGDGMCIMSIIEDITERRRSEKSLKETEENFRILFNENPHPTLLAEIPSGKIAVVNKRLADQLGMDIEDVIGKTPNEINLLHNPGDQEKLTGLIVNRGLIDDIEVEKILPTGEKGTDLISMRLITMKGKEYCLTVIQDITDRKRVEKTLQNTQRLESLGVLAGGIAHDFNNLLTGIYGYMDLARCVSEDSRITHYLDAMFSTMKRAKALTMQLLTFAKGGSPVQRITPLPSFIRETAGFALSGSNSSCRFSLAEDLRPCNIDKDQIAQVIDNIVINAQQAMPDGGEIEISAVNISFEENEHPPLLRGDYVRVSIKDSGIGIPTEILSRIFDPFFTTKSKGYGLGLATSYSIISRHGGCIDVESEPGKGSTFHVHLPASSETAPDSAAAATRHAGSGTIVVMDDEAVVRDAFRQMLEMLGYTVICKNNGKEVIDWYGNQASGSPPVAMIFDLTVPGGMGGTQAAAEIRKIHKDIPIFVASGYADDSVMKNPAEYGFTASIPKPFTISDLSEVLNKNVKS